MQCIATAAANCSESRQLTVSQGWASERLVHSSEAGRIVLLSPEEVELHRVKVCDQVASVL